MEVDFLVSHVKGFLCHFLLIVIGSYILMIVPCSRVSYSVHKSSSSANHIFGGSVPQGCKNSPLLQERPSQSRGVELMTCLLGV